LIFEFSVSLSLSLCPKHCISGYSFNYACRKSDSMSMIYQPTDKPFYLKDLNSCSIIKSTPKVETKVE